MAKGPIQRLYDRRVLTFNRKAASLGIRGRVTAEELAALPLRCHYCRIELQHTQSDFDHKVPFAKGGTNTIDNIVRACGLCNGQKFTKTEEEHAEYQAMIWICPVDGKPFRPRHNDWRNGNGRVCSRSCAGKRRWMNREPRENPARSSTRANRIHSDRAGGDALPPTR